MELAAHTPNAGGAWHGLAAHLQAVAERARSFAEPLGAPEMGYLLGLWHDVGKAHPQFQTYLAEAAAQPGVRRRGPDHKGAGALLAAGHLGTAAMAIQGHHGGLRSLVEFQAWLEERKNDPAVAEALAIAAQRLSITGPQDPIPRQPHLIHRRKVELFVRLLFSALVDADFLDTEAHFTPASSRAREQTSSLEGLWERFQADQVALTATATPSQVNDVRQEVYQACLAAAEQPPGFFRLTVPTGGGKTRAGMAFALQHALKHKQRQVIVAVPFITITQQTAGVYRDIFDQPDEPPAVLEHHSGSTGEDDPDEYSPDEVWKRLSAENWDAPIVVTTTVQLFESLFSNRISACRKLHRLAKSVVILDEAQALPPHLLEPILDGLRDLVEHYGTTVVLSTATQPAFDSVPGFSSLQAREIVSQFLQHFSALKRVNYDWRTSEPVSWDDVAAMMREAAQTLAVVNTKRDALAMLDALGDPEALHLSTLLCGAHRSEVLGEVLRRLTDALPCRVVSTQVVEAGVDLDFPLVLRALGPLDSIIQAAGRCNREGRLDRGRVVVFMPAEGGMPPGAYRTGAQEALAILAAGTVDPDDPTAIRRYFQRFYQDVATDREGVQSQRDALDYPEVNKLFRMIDDDTLSVVVTTHPGPEENLRVHELIDELTLPQPANARRILRQLQPYVVSVRRHQAERLQQQGLITPVLGGAIGVWHGQYDPVRGLVATDPEALVV